MICSINMTADRALEVSSLKVFKQNVLIPNVSPQKGMKKLYFGAN